MPFSDRLKDAQDDSAVKQEMEAAARRRDANTCLLPQCSKCGSYALYRLPDSGLICLTCVDRWEQAQRAAGRPELEITFENFVRESGKPKPARVEGRSTSAHGATRSRAKGQ